MARKRKNQPKDNYLAARLLGGSMMAVVLIVFGFVLGNMFGQKDAHNSTTARAEAPLAKATQPRPSIGAGHTVNSSEPKYTFYKELQERQRELERGGITAPLPPVPETVALRPVRVQPEPAVRPKPAKKPAAERLTEKPVVKPTAETAAKTLTEPAKPAKKTAVERLTATPEASGKPAVKQALRSKILACFGAFKFAREIFIVRLFKAEARPAKAEPAAKTAKTDGKAPVNSRLTAQPEAVGKDGKEAAASGKDGKDKDAKKNRPVTGKRTNYRIQVGAFKNKAQAEQLRAKMAQRGLPVDIRPPSDSNKLYLVQIGPYASESQATGIQAKLKADGQAAQLKTFNSGTDSK